jgi:tetratricopeptide (TPR) repeat protein
VPGIRAEEASWPLARSRRFELVRTIGSGAMGVVHEVVDRERGARVALKTVRSLDAAALLRFKNEFRALADIDHPNLVSLGELASEDGQLYFTMELVAGTHLIRYVRPGEPSLSDESGERAPLSVGPRSIRAGDHFDEAKVRSAFLGVARGLSALHAAHKVHRDVKPSNVLVTDAGRVVILDFGVIRDVIRDEAEALVVGTAHYMAPEQAARKPVGPEADWYSVGAMLYVALTGGYPFLISPEGALELKQHMDPPRPSAVAHQPIPPDLEQLCVDLLRRDPAARPTGPEVMARLGARAAGSEPPRSRGAAFVGRTEELEQLREAFRETAGGAAVAVLIEGESGVGKSALWRRFLDEIAANAEPPGRETERAVVLSAREPPGRETGRAVVLSAREPVVLAGRCYERESVPYKAVDEAIDALALHLGRLPAGEVAALLPSGAAQLGEIFPVLRKVGAIADLARRERALVDPGQGRAVAFAALRELLRRIAVTRPVVLGIDDLQWADADGLALIAELLRDAPPLLFVATVRTGAEISQVRPALLAELRQGMIRVIPVAPLRDEDARALVSALLGDHAPRLEVDVDALIEEAAGHPLFIDALIRHRLHASAGDAPIRLDDALWARIARLPGRARLLLELCAVAGAPLPLAIAGHAATAERDELGRLLGALRAANLVKTTGLAATDLLETYHDRVRETVLRHLDASARRTWHGRLALAFEDLGLGELEVLAVHWRESGDAIRAADYAVRAAGEAALALAFDRAARLYRMAIELGPGVGGERRRLLVRLGETLDNAGRGAEAARAYLAAIPGAEDALDLHRRAAENLLRSGYFDEGMAELRTVLGAVGMDVPRTPARTLALLLARRAQLRVRGLGFVERAAADIDPAVLRRVDVCWSAALGLGMIDMLTGTYFQTMNLLLALDAGEPYRIARAVAFQVPFMSVAGPSSAPRVEEALNAARALAERTAYPHALGLVHTGSGSAAYLSGRWRDALVDLDRAEVIFRERCTGVSFERRSMITVAAWTLWFLGDLRELCRRVALHVREAEERGDRYTAANLRSYLSNAVWLIQGDPARARREADQAIGSWSKAGYHLQHFHDLLARAQIALYEGDPREAYRGLREGWPPFERSLSMRMQLVRIYMKHLRARAALGCAAVAPAEHRAEIALAIRTARELEREDALWAAPLAATLRAGIAAIGGDKKGALAALGRAEEGFRVRDMALFEAAALRRRGQLVGGAAGWEMTEAGSAWMRGQGVVDPERMTAVLIPRFA